MSPNIFYFLSFVFLAALFRKVLSDAAQTGVDTSRATEIKVPGENLTLLLSNLYLAPFFRPSVWEPERA
jgi:hypothetical protein